MTTLPAAHAQVRARGHWIDRWEAWLDRPECFVGGSWIKQAQDLDAIQTRREEGLAPRVLKDWTWFAAEQATSHAFHLLKDQLGLQAVKSTWSGGIQEHHARRIFELARALERPAAIPLADSREIGVEELGRRFPHLREHLVLSDFHSPKAQADERLMELVGLHVPKKPGSHHQWWEARAIGFFQRYGHINRHAIRAMRGGGSNCDFSLAANNGCLIAVEVMSGWWNTWDGKRKVAERFAELGVTTVFIGVSPPWESSDCHPSPRRLWTPSGVITVGDSLPEEEIPSKPWGPGLPMVYHLPEPELCDVRGRPLIEVILESSLRRGRSLLTALNS